jgi:hypothetical protein
MLGSVRRHTPLPKVATHCVTCTGVFPLQRASFRRVCSACLCRSAWRRAWCWVAHRGLPLSTLCCVGQWLVTGSDDKTVRLWEVATGRQFACLDTGVRWAHVAGYLLLVLRRCTPGARCRRNVCVTVLSWCRGDFLVGLLSACLPRYTAAYWCRVLCKPWHGIRTLPCTSLRWRRTNGGSLGGVGGGYLHPISSLHCRNHSPRVGAHLRVWAGCLLHRIHPGKLVGDVKRVPLSVCCLLWAVGRAGCFLCPRAPGVPRRPHPPLRSCRAAWLAKVRRCCGPAGPCSPAWTPAPLPTCQVHHVIFARCVRVLCVTLSTEACGHGRGRG